MLRRNNIYSPNCIYNLFFTFHSFNFHHLFPHFLFDVLHEPLPATKLSFHELSENGANSFNIFLQRTPDEAHHFKYISDELEFLTEFIRSTSQISTFNLMESMISIHRCGKNFSLMTNRYQQNVIDERSISGKKLNDLDLRGGGSKPDFRYNFLTYIQDPSFLGLSQPI